MCVIGFSKIDLYKVKHASIYNLFRKKTDVSLLINKYDKTWYKVKCKTIINLHKRKITFKSHLN